MHLKNFMIPNKDGTAMQIDIDSLVPYQVAEKNFTKTIRIAEEIGKVYIVKDNKPRYLLIDLEVEPELEMTDEEKIEFIGRRILKDHKRAFEELAK